MQRTKEEFDAEARKLLSYIHVPLHNKFLLALFKRCQGLDSSPGPPGEHLRRKDASRAKPGTLASVERDKKSRVKRRRSEKSAFEPASVAEHCAAPASPPPDLTALTEHRCSRSLPDQALVCGRMLVTAWEHGLMGVAEPAEEYVMLAMEIFVKNAVQAVMMRKTGYRMTPGGFVYDMGATVPNPWLCNTAKLRREIYNRYARESDEEEDEDPDKISKTDVNLEDIEANAAYAIACGSGSLGTAAAPVSAWDLFEAMQIERRMFRANSVYVMNMERLIMLLEHPSHEEIEAVSKC
ncbi:transcriptional adapter 1-like isoform X2 [Bacillus rossius redtenbacheri]